jgi:hypothetical protein
MFVPVPILRARRTAIGKIKVVTGAVGKLTVVVSSILLFAIIAVTVLTLDAWLFTNNFP